MALAQMIYHPLNSTANLFGTVHDRHPEISRSTCPERTKWVEWGSKFEIDGFELREQANRNKYFGLIFPSKVIMNLLP